MPSAASRIGFSLAISTLFTPAVLGAQTSGTVGERAQGMGGAFVAVADDASAIYWNPAGLAWPTGSTFDAQVSVADDIFFFAAALPPLGLSYYRLPIVLTSGGRQNEGSGEVPIRTLMTNNVGVTLNQTVGKGLVIGTTLRVVRGGIDGASGSTTFDADVGAMLTPTDFLRVGVTARNLRKPGFMSDLGQISMDRQVRLGVALVPRSLPTGVQGPFSLAFDADLAQMPGALGGRREASVGGEYWVAQGRLGMRAGMRWNTLEVSERAISGGLTAQLPHSVFVEGHVTKDDQQDEVLWGLGARLTF